MTNDANAAADDADRQGRSLQPRDGTDSDIEGDLQRRELLRELRDIEDPVLAERLERRLGDADLILRLQLSGFDTETADWQELAHDLARYGYGVIAGWGRSGVLRMMAAQHGSRGVLGLSKVPFGLELVGDEPHELAVEIVYEAIEKFRTKTLMNPDPNKRWRPDGGASLRTFFVGRCLMELPDAYVRWDATRAGLAGSVDVTDHPEVQRRGSTIGRPEASLAAAELEAVRGRLGMTQADELMFKWRAEGYAYDEIVEMLGDAGHVVTEAQMRTRMSRLRAAAKAGRW